MSNDKTLANSENPLSHWTETIKTMDLRFLQGRLQQKLIIKHTAIHRDPTGGFLLTAPTLKESTEEVWQDVESV